MNVPQQPENGREPPGRGAPLPVASPLDPPLGNEPMQPVRPVSPDAAALLPPVGLLSQSRTPPPARPPSPIEPPRPALASRVRHDGNVLQGPAIPEGPVVTPTRHTDVQKKWAAGGGSSAAWTAIMVLTAIGAGAMAIVPLLSSGGDAPDDVARHADRTRARAGDSAREPDDPLSLREAQMRQSERSAARGEGPLTRRTVAPDPEREAQLASELAEITRLLRGRDMVAARARIEQLAARGWSPPLRERIESYSSLVSAIEVFLANLQEALDKTGAGRTIIWRGRDVPIVGVTDTTVTVLVNRNQVRLQRNSLPDDAVRALAEGVLDMNDPRNLIHLGAFLFVTEEGQEVEARRLWRRAAAAGEDVGHFEALLQPST